MALADITRESVLAAIREFDEKTRDAFLKEYGFGRSRGYFLSHGGRRYDSKAIAAVGHKYALGTALKAADFSGGKATVEKTLTNLGFEIITPSDPSPLSIQYQIGKVYSRQSDVHQQYGGQERGGIATPAGVPFVFLFTGDSGEAYGYKDGWQADGSFSYTGEGQKGDMEFVRGNLAIRDAEKNGKDLLLFSALQTKGQYRFVGVFGCAGNSLLDAKDKDGNDRTAIVFSLVRKDDTTFAAWDEVETKTAGFDQLRRQAFEASEAAAKTGTGVRAYYIRSARVRDYVLRRANGNCEGCKCAAPFKRNDGTPYLEPHHIKRVSDGGPDTPDSVIALCPNCHRRVHHAIDGQDYNSTLLERTRAIEAELGKLQ